MERLEQARILAEMEEQRVIEEERRKLEMERKLATEKEKKETAEQALRVEQLTNSNLLIRNMSDYDWNIGRKEQDAFKWGQYLKCDGLPDPTKPSQMSTYLHIWREVNHDVTVEEGKRRTAEIIALLQVLEDSIDDPFDASETMIENWKWIRSLCREQQHENLNMISYRLLRDIDQRLNRPEIPTADFTVIDENFIICLWLSVNLAVPMRNPRAPARKRLEINFPETRLNILFPTVLDPKSIVIRTIYVKYDHLSDNCETYDRPCMLSEVDKDLFHATAMEWYVKMKYKWDNYHRPVVKLDETKEGGLKIVMDGKKKTFSEWKGTDVAPSVPYKKLEPTASQYAISIEGKKDKGGKKKEKSDAESGTSKETKKSKKGKGEGKKSKKSSKEDRKRPTRTISWTEDRKKRPGRSSSAMLKAKRSSSVMEKRSSVLDSTLKESFLIDSDLSIGSEASDFESKLLLTSTSLLRKEAKRSKSKKRKAKKPESFLTYEASSEETYLTEEEAAPGKKKKKKEKKKGKKEGKKKTPSRQASAVKAETPKEVKETPPTTEETKGKGKKKKKGKKGETPEAPPEDTDDVMAQIQKMKALAAAQAAGPAEEEVKPEEAPAKKGKKGKKGKKKKKTGEDEEPKFVRRMSNAERVRLEAEKFEQAKMQAELEAKRAEEEERRRIEEEKRQGREKERREMAEQQLRVEQLVHSMQLAKNVQDFNWNTNAQEKVDLEWERYLKCDGLPDPTKPAEMNTYLHLWEQVLTDVTVDEVKHRTEEIIELLQALEDVIDDPFDAPEHLVNDWKWVRSLCREHQQENLNMATYRLLRDIDTRLNRIDIPTADFNIDEKDFKLSLWLYVQLATPMFNPRAPPKKRVEIDLPPMGLNVLFPSNLEGKCLAIRVMYMKYDHLSDTCATYPRPAIPQEIDIDLYDMVCNEWYAKMKFKWEHRKPPPKKMIEDEEGNMIEVEEPEPELIPGEIPPAVPWQKLEPTASQNEIELETELYERCRLELCVEVDEKVINLRKYLIIGGVYYIDLFYQPPQPHDQVAFDIRITALEIPKKLVEVPFYIPYNPLPEEDPEDKKTPEEREEEIKQQEADLDRLMMVTLTLPDHVMFLDLPQVCHWDKERKLWTMEDVHDLKHIEEKNYMTFRTGRFGPFALAVNRYINFPFQAWELKPEPDGSVTFQITCAILMVEFNVKGNRVCLTQLQNSPNNAMQDIVGIYFKLPKLIRLLQTGGVDLFPACDAFCYVDGVCEKHWPTEKHLYHNMALLSPSYNFAWSRWNVQAGRRNIVLQMREYKLNSTKQKGHSMLLVTPLKATFIEVTEVAPIFNDTPSEGMKFYSDLFNLMKGTSTMATRNKVQNGPQDVAKVLSDLLIMTRVVSFS